MDVRLACSVLGVGPTPTWAEVRVAYRAQITAWHPDRPSGDAQRARQVTEAYATLERALREGRLPTPSVRPHPSPPVPPWAHRRGPEPEPGEPPEVLEGDTVRLAAPPDEAFSQIVDACHRIGDVTYLDRSCAILETLVRVHGEGVCSLVITLQGRAEGTDAFCTLEAIERVASPPVRDVVDQLVAALRHP